MRSLKYILFLFALIFASTAAMATDDGSNPCNTALGMLPSQMTMVVCLQCIKDDGNKLQLNEENNYLYEKIVTLQVNFEGSSTDTVCTDTYKLFCENLHVGYLVVEQNPDSRYIRVELSSGYNEERQLPFLDSTFNYPYIKIGFIAKAKKNDRLVGKKIHSFMGAYIEDWDKETDPYNSTIRKLSCHKFVKKILF